MLVCLVHNNKVYTANAGDSLGILIEEGNNFIYERSRHDEIHLDKSLTKRKQAKRTITAKKSIPCLVRHRNLQEVKQHVMLRKRPSPTDPFIRRPASQARLIQQPLKLPALKRLPNAPQTIQWQLHHMVTLD